VRDANDSALQALAGGEVGSREIALDPGQATTLGRTAAGTIAVLLPGMSAACLWAYELVAGAAVRTMAGLDPALPFPALPMTTTRKIASRIGTTEIWPVRRAGETTVEPIMDLARDSLIAATSADGFVVIPEASEGVPAGAAVTVYLIQSGP
jgi:molybdopterin molybdotransferase